MFVRDNDCDARLAIVRTWLSDEDYAATKGLVEDYYFEDQFRGVWFDRLASETPTDAIIGDLDAVRALSVRFPRAFVEHLEREDVRQHFSQALAQIPYDLALEDLSCTDFEKHLGRDCIAWKTWDELSDCLKKANARAPYVGASKLLAAKRLRLIPLDDSFVQGALSTPRAGIWKVIHRTYPTPKSEKSSSGYATRRREPCHHPPGS
jgi:hypothetical protein